LQPGRRQRRDLEGAGIRDGVSSAGEWLMRAYGTPTPTRKQVEKAVFELAEDPVWRRAERNAIGGYGVRKEVNMSGNS